jgi:trimeric autotransporter adhesin
VPTAPTHTFIGGGLVQYYAFPAHRESCRLPASVIYPRGTVLGELWGANAVYTVTLGTPSAGTFTLTVGANTTAGIAFNAAATAVQTALTGLASVGAGNATVTGANGGPYTVTFVNARGAQAVTLTGSGAGLTGGAFSVASVTTGAAGTPGTFSAYAAANTDGTQIPKGVLEYDCATDASGNIFWGTTAVGEWGVGMQSAPYFYRGAFACGDLTGLDPNCLAPQSAGGGGWRLVHGTIANGVVLLP